MKLKIFTKKNKIYNGWLAISSKKTIMNNDVYYHYPEGEVDSVNAESKNGANLEPTGDRISFDE